MSTLSIEKSDVPTSLANGSTAYLVELPKKGDQTEEYNPFENRNLVHPTSDLDTFVHLLKGSLGSGILAMPLAFANAGLGFGLFCTLFVGTVCTYCIHILVKSAHELYRRTKVPSLGYDEVAETAFLSGPKFFHKWSRTARALVNIFLVADLLGCCCVYIVFVSKNIKQVVDYYTESNYDLRLYMAAMLLPLILLNLIRNLKYLAPFSMVANVLIGVGLGITLYYIFTDLPPIESRPNFVEYYKLPMFFGTAIFALEGIGVVMPLENNMKTPQNFIGCPGVLNSGMSIVVFLYALVGFFGYWKYGPITEGSITLNLDNTQVLAQSVKIMIAVAIFLTYGLQFYVPMEIIWKGLNNNWGVKKLSVEYVLRITLVTATVGVAILIPNLGGFISLIGAVCLSMLGMIFPALIELVTFYEDPGLGRFNWRLWKNLFLITFGVVGFVTGSYLVNLFKIGDESEEYNPFENRNLAHPTTDLDTFAHLLKGCLGSGILAMPLAFAHAGLGFGLFCTLFVGAICTYCIHILVKSAHALYWRTKVPSLTYDEVAETAFSSGPKCFQRFSRTARTLVNIFLAVDLLGCCCVYVVFVSKNIKQVVDYHTETNYDVRLYMAVMLPVLILANLVRNLKYLAPFSMVANVLIGISMGITFYYVFVDLPSFDSRPNFVEFNKLPFFFGTAIFALEGIGVVMPLENNMKTPQHFIGCPGVLNSGMAIVVLLYAFVGFFGYLKYGPLTEGSITLNLDSTEVLAQSVKVMIAVAIFLTYGLQFYVPMGIIWRGLSKNWSSSRLGVEYAVRISLVTATVATAILVPNLGGFISLIGAVCLSVLGMIFPALIELVTFYEDPGLGRFKWRLWKDLFLILFGVVGFISGSYVSVLEIIESYELY